MTTTTMTPATTATTTPGDAPYAIQLFARWSDMDFNQHMRNAAYLGASEDCRMRFLAEGGFAAAELARRRIGPVVLEDRLSYKKELPLLEGFRVELTMAAITRDARRMKLRNTFLRERDGALVATMRELRARLRGRPNRVTVVTGPGAPALAC
jgi:acyl-CoA thioester hydrolase